jgi:hypothetical protein
MQLARLNRAEMCALIVETLASFGIEVVLVGGSCVCIYTNERFGSMDLDFIDLTYSRRKEIAAALATIGFTPRGNTKYFEHPGCQWSVEFPTAPLAIGHEQIDSTRIASIKTATGTVRLLNPTDTVKDRLLWFYLEQDGQCWQQALDIARNHRIIWRDLKRWHEKEGYADEYTRFRSAVTD